MICVYRVGKYVIDSPFYRNDGAESISFYNFNGKRAILELKGN